MRNEYLLKKNVRHNNLQVETSIIYCFKTLDEAKAKAEEFNRQSIRDWYNIEPIVIFNSDEEKENNYDN